MRMIRLLNESFAGAAAWTIRGSEKARVISHNLPSFPENGNPGKRVFEGKTEAALVSRRQPLAILFIKTFTDPRRNKVKLRGGRTKVVARLDGKATV